MDNTVGFFVANAMMPSEIAGSGFSDGILADNFAKFDGKIPAVDKIESVYLLPIKIK